MSKRLSVREIKIIKQKDTGHLYKTRQFNLRRYTDSQNNSLRREWLPAYEFSQHCRSAENLPEVHHHHHLPSRSRSSGLLPEVHY
jgi:hypothetical protein